jgi:hypothetical protein
MSIQGISSQTEDYYQAGFSEKVEEKLNELENDPSFIKDSWFPLWNTALISVRVKEESTSVVARASSTYMYPYSREENITAVKKALNIFFELREQKRKLAASFPKTPLPKVELVTSNAGLFIKTSRVWSVDPSWPIASN